MVFKSTKGLNIGAVVTGIILLVIFFNVASTALPEVNTASNLINVSGVANGTAGTGGLPFRALFNSNGIIMIGIMAGILLGVFGALGYAKGKR